MVRVFLQIPNLKWRKRKKTLNPSLQVTNLVQDSQEEQRDVKGSERSRRKRWGGQKKKRRRQSFDIARLCHLCLFIPPLSLLLPDSLFVSLHMQATVQVCVRQTFLSVSSTCLDASFFFCVCAGLLDTNASIREQLCLSEQ